MKPIATSTSDFADLITHGGIYVDKTAYFYRLVSNEMNNLLFLARPRRFGKSLMITALKEIFSGRRELFDGLAISKTDWKWEKWPVIHFEFADVDTTSIESFEREFAVHVDAASPSSNRTCGFPAYGFPLSASLFVTAFVLSSL